LAHVLPAQRTVITCHDLDTFRSVLEPGAVRRSFAFRAMTRHILDGFRHAAHIVCDTEAIRAEVVGRGLARSDQTSVVPVGVHPDCRPEADPVADAEAERLLSPAGRDVAYVLHVGSTIPRKRIDVLLRSFADARRQRSDLRLIRVGGPFTAPQADLAAALGIAGQVIELPFVSRRVLGAVYRKAWLTVIPSDAEGFGLPVVEALAAGTPVLASDIPVLREVGADAAVYLPVADVTAWANAIVTLCDERMNSPERWAERRRAGIEHARQFSWSTYAARMVSIYDGVLDNAGESDLRVSSLRRT
jgi:glycosyltransferase involved in cell wall biosynthesis